MKGGRLNLGVLDERRPKEEKRCSASQQSPGVRLLLTS